jgi:carboxylesterase type B
LLKLNAYYPKLGLSGWLGGDKLQSLGGQVNAGLRDIAMSLSWVQDNIHKFGGDKNKVNLWGQSGGAGAVLHQLLLDGGSSQPNFTRAMIMSSAYDARFDTSGSGLVGQVFESLATSASCTTSTLSCLSALPTGVLGTIGTTLTYKYYNAYCKCTKVSGSGY